MANRVRYPIDQSPFFRLATKRKLAQLLGVEAGSLPRLATPKYYRVFQNEKGRWIQHPIGPLKAVHIRIAKLLGRIQLPDYVHSQKGRSYVTNAKAHLGPVPVIKTDISAYYPSVTFSQIFRLFREEFECPQDVAWLIASICTFDGKHVPTGSELSGIVAFLATQRMFDEIASLGRAEGCTMTCYVDDVVLSGPSASKRLLVKVRQIARKHGLDTKDSKSKTFSAQAPKTITGCVVRGGRLLLPNVRHEKIARLIRELNAATSPETARAIEASLKGRLLEASQLTLEE